MGLIQDLYAANKENRMFLHARFDLGNDGLKPYKETIDRWLWPDVLRNQDASVVKAKQAISSYKKAVGEPAGLAELMVFYCERAVGFCSDVGYQDEGYLMHWFVCSSRLSRLPTSYPPVNAAPSSPGWTARAPSATISAMASVTIWTPCLRNT